MNHEVRNWKEIVKRATRELKRAQRRSDREQVIAKRLKVAKAHGHQPKAAGMMDTKLHGIAKCGNKGCFICACERQVKRDKVKAERTKGRKEERHE